MSGEILVTSLVALLSGGFVVEVFRAWKDRKRVDLDLFYPTWKEEMARLHDEISQLRVIILQLSAEVHRLGGDPVTITYTASVADLLEAEAEKAKPDESS